MKIYTEKKLVEIKNQALNKIYNALDELHQKDNSDKNHLVKDRHEELLDLALKHYYSKPTQNVYGWSNTGKMKGTFYN